MRLLLLYLRPELVALTVAATAAAAAGTRAAGAPVPIGVTTITHKAATPHALSHVLLTMPAAQPPSRPAAQSPGKLSAATCGGALQ